ncbi:MAG: hypothetical protein EXS17_07810 [Phycisphaerales bacterium]|nr:hypothetical protein [Phycisphaerales bacterium]
MVGSRLVSGYYSFMFTYKRLCFTAAALAIMCLGCAQSAQLSAPTVAQGESTKAAKPKRGPGLRFGVENPPKKGGAIRIAAYNLLNLFDHVDDPTLDNKWEEEKLRVTQDRANALAKAIHKLDADVLVVEEVESKEALLWFRDTYLKDMDYKFVESLDAGYYRGVEQSVLSRFPLKNARVFLDAKLKSSAPPPPADEDHEPSKDGAIPNDQTKFQRSPLAVDVDCGGGYELTVYAIHHKAGGKAFEDHRAAEAAKIIELIQSDLTKNPARNLVLLGDFNSTPNSDVVKLYKAAGLVNGYDARPEADKAKEKDRALPDAQRDALREKYTTHESGRPIDYIMCSTGFAAEVVPGSFFIMSTLHPGDAYDWKTDAPPAGYASDHYPIAIEFTPKDVEPVKTAPASASPR